MAKMIPQQEQYPAGKSFPPVASAGFLTCWIADFPIGNARRTFRAAGLETCETADLEVCATAKR